MLFQLNPIVRLPRLTGALKSAGAAFLLSITTLPALASQPIFRQDIAIGDDFSYISSLQGGFDCTALYHDDDRENASYCFDGQVLFNTEDGLYTAHFEHGKVASVEYRVPLTQSNYNGVLAGLRRQNYVFVRLEVGNEELDVLSGLRVLDSQTLDAQMFALANRYDFTVAREYWLVDNRSFKRALRRKVNDTEHWLSQTQTEGFDELIWVKLYVEGDELVLVASQPLT
ncbi:hypothetical protein C9I98_07665 [Photobacterium sanctipauli]|uniref:Uncharacterized protein n=1 Tax=Photobacterium sanctipauli TaxID=1342794 RepID=A0A2T3NWT2_9GAMM|nr:hypothetical protein [Photobacterium sanctipauli]PSW20711.1 hypothetical protein C9I98_07665 [Photobacterium sanctipauli]